MVEGAGSAGGAVTMTSKGGISGLNIGKQLGMLREGVDMG